ncbi:MAG: transcription termination/antitermination protein NusG [Candidatus Electryoneaceae bacterium]|nr:transcription termination/antitermination protein NusG [Candidatus Electryoneaceae bacterium]
MTEQDSTQQWFVLRVFTGKEKKVKSYMEQQIKRMGYEDRIGEILVPSETIIEMRDGKRRERDRVLFPGYMLIQMDLEREIRFFVTNLPDVIGFADKTRDPDPLPLDEINRILGRSVEGEKDGQVLVDVPFNVDDVVKISDGPFKDFIGSVKEINFEKRKLKVLVSIFGRSTPVEVDFLQVTTNLGP